MAKLFLTEGADINYEDDNRQTPFHYARKSTNANLDLVKFLINRGCDMNAVNENGYTGFGCACIVENMNLIKFFHEKLDAGEFKTHSQNGFYLSCDCGFLNIVEFLVENGVDINNIDASGWPRMGWGGIHYACYKGYVSIVKYLMEKGCDLHLIDQYGNTGLQLACYQNHFSVIQCLVNFIVFEGIKFWNVHMTDGLHILLENFTADDDSTDPEIIPSILLLLEAGAQLEQNNFLPSEIKDAVKHRLVEITFVKSKLVEKFSPRIAQLITDFTMIPSMDTSFQNLPQHLF